MSSTHDFTSKRVALTGRFSNTKDKFARELEALGAKVTMSVSSKTDYLITGTQTGGAARARATQMGIIILNEAEARAVMRGETIEVPLPGEGGEASIDELLGEARSLLARLPSAHVWHALLDLFDACTIEHHAALTEYIHAHTSQWDAAEMAGQYGQELLEEEIDADMERRDARVMKRLATQRSELFRGELRVAPSSWRGEIVQGSPQVKFTLIKALSLTANATTLIKALSSEALGNLTRLELLPHPKPTKKLAKALTRFEWLPRLTHLGLGAISPDLMAHMREHSTPGALNTLDLTHLLYTDYGKVPAIHDDFVNVPLFAPVERLFIRRIDDRACDLASRIVKQDRFPKLHTLHITTQSRLRGSMLTQLIQTGLLDRVTTLGIGAVQLFPRRLEDSWEGLWCKSIPANISTINARYLRIEPSMTAAHYERAVEIMSEGLLLRHVDTLELGEWLDEPRLVQPLSQLCPDLTLTR